MLVVGASAGIGRATATVLAGRGAAVVFAARRREILDQAVVDAGGGHAVALDVRDEASCDAAVDEVVSQVGGLDALLYCAGVASLGTLDEQTAEDWREVLETNVMGAALVTRAFIPHVCDNGVAAYLSSISTDRPRRALVSYAASKAALDSLIEGLRVEYRLQRFVRIVIGDTEGTEFASEFDKSTFADVFPQWLAETHLKANTMKVQDLGEALAELFGLMFSHPDIDLSDLRLEPPGGPATMPPDEHAMEVFTRYVT